MCICLGRITHEEAMKCAYGKQRSLLPVVVSDRKLVLQYTLEGTKGAFAKIADDFRDNKEVADSSEGDWKAKIVMVITNILQIVQRVLEAIAFFLRYIPGVAVPSVVIRPEVKAPALSTADRASIFTP